MTIIYPNWITDTQEKNKLYPNICLGGASGFLLNKTIIYKLMEFNTAKDFTSKNLYLKFWDESKNRPIHNHNYDDKLISPRALKLAQNPNGEIMMLGW